MSGKVIELFRCRGPGCTGNPCHCGVPPYQGVDMGNGSFTGTFSNRIDDAKPITFESVEKVWRELQVTMRRARMRVVK